MFHERTQVAAAESRFGSASGAEDAEPQRLLRVDGAALVAGPAWGADDAASRQDALWALEPFD